MVNLGLFIIFKCTINVEANMLTDMIRVHKCTCMCVYLSCPAVSHSCKETTFSFSMIDLLKKSTPVQRIDLGHDTYT